MTATDLAVTPDEVAPVDAPDARGRPGLVTLAWLLGALAVVTLGYVAVAVRNRGFFLVDDDDSAIVPMFSYIGHELRAGHWPGTSDRNWTVGLVAGDPQYALYNPLSLLSYWAVDPIGSLVWRLFLIVLLWVNLLTVGVFWAARTLGCSPPFAALAAVMAGLNLYVLYWQAAGWTSILPGVAWFSIAVAALLAALDRPDRPWRAVVAGLLVAGTVAGGSPFALQALITASAVLVLSRVLGPRRIPVRRLGLVIASGVSGAVLGAVPWVVSLHYVDYTRRQGGDYNNGFLTFHLESLLMSFSPAVRPFTGAFRGWGSLDQPVTYGSWLFAGAVAVAVVRRVRLRPLEIGVLAAGIVLFVLTFGPEHYGPVRWPFRLVPFAFIMLAVATVVVLERAMASPARDDRDHRVIFAIAVLVAAGITFLLHASLVAAAVTFVVVAAGVPFVVWCVRDRRRLVLVGTGVASTLAIWLAVVAQHPRPTDLVDLGGPGDIATAAQLTEPLAGHRTLQIINGYPHGVESVIGGNLSLYGTAPAEVINGYTSLVPDGLGNALCVTDTSFACPDLPARLFRIEPETGQRYVDLFGLTQVLVQRGPLLDSFLAARSPEWQPSDETADYVLFRNGGTLRDDPIAWTSEGVVVEPNDRGRELVTAPAGGQIVLSRPNWPGTSISVGGVDADLRTVGGIVVGATFREPVSGELVVTQRVPGQGQAVAAVVLGVLLLSACAVVAALRSRRGRVPPSQPADAAPTVPTEMNSL